MKKLTKIKKFKIYFYCKRVKMQLHNTSQYAIRILSYIANHGEDRLYSAKELSEVLTISYKFLTKIMAELVKAKLVNSIKGREGGYELSRPASTIKIVDILDTFNERVDDDKCILGIGICDGNNKCGLHDQWVEPKNLIQKMFEETTLDNLEGDNFKI